MFILVVIAEGHAIPQNMFKLVDYETRTVVKPVVGILLKCFLVFT